MRSGLISHHLTFGVSMSATLPQFKAHVARIDRLTQINSLVEWDQQTNMPPGAAGARAEQSATLSQLIHEMATSEQTGQLLSQCEAELVGQDPDSDDVRLVAVARRNYDKATKLPTALVAEMARHTSLSQEIWVRARQHSDFDAFAPALEKMLDLTRQAAEHLGYKEHIYDALIDQYEPGTTQADVAAMFAEMKPRLVALTQTIADSPHSVDAGPIHGQFPVEKQRALTLQVVKAIGYDLNRGRQDEAAHPFCTNFSRDDVRITTRFNAAYLSQAIYASMHEAGHAMYEQGSPAAYEATPLAGGASLGVHESQSRLWENLVGRSRAFSRYLFPQLQQTFPDQFAQVDAESYYRAINKVEPSFIRVEADEVTYNLHILLRFELECALLTGQLAVEDLPDAWDAKMQEYLGITPHTDGVGCLQDVHWSIGLIGYFPTYSIGNLLSGQIWHAIRQAMPDLEEQIACGEFAPLLEWLREHVHGYGRKYLPRELVVKATGEPLTSRYYLDYLQAKYSDIYQI
jgi:carboxypeptidase Taq